MTNRRTFWVIDSYLERAPLFITSLVVTDPQPVFSKPVLHPRQHICL